MQASNIAHPINFDGQISEVPANLYQFENKSEMPLMNQHLIAEEFNGASPQKSLHIPPVIIQEDPGQEEEIISYHESTMGAVALKGLGDNLKAISWGTT